MIKPKKSLGQNFLKSKTTAQKIVACLRPAQADCILEIGPGTGVLTEFLMKTGARVFAVDIDSRLTNFLSQKFSHVDNLQVFCADILEFDLNSLNSNRRIKVIGNLPYHLTAPILEKLCDNHELIESAVLTIQKEVAERICAEVGSSDYSSLTVFIQNFGLAKKLFNLDSKQFHPPPNVTSTVIKLELYENPVIETETYRKVRELVRCSFSQKRKMMVNSLIKAYSLDREKAQAVLLRAGIDPKSRPQNLTLEMFHDLIKALENNER